MTLLVDSERPATAAFPVVEPVSSNGWPIRRDPASLAEMHSCNSDNEIERAWSEDGFLLLRNYIPCELIEAALKQYRADSSIAARQSQSAAYGTKGHPAYSLVRSHAFLELCAAPRLAPLATRLLRAPVRQLQRRILRHYRGEKPAASRAHRDWSYIDQGGKDVVVFWVPFVATGPESGGLVYLQGSRALQESDVPRLVKNNCDRPQSAKVFSSDLQGLADATGLCWRYAEMQPGDVLVHDAMIVHASLDCQPGRDRISTDIRFVRREDPQDHRWQNHWAADDGY
jgi:ectoine hydroxylase-related dioxygenase (phytanoyl-CoA dioxygenase family)